ncbi:zincin-like metallopeptidase domain-containing protein [Fundidesulfovibrio putealis]|uniref:zincin-like metallopeptidase domain-containing protein n=1 Tax=Fundidesulfovibrio putealis TaxID=270496 RepID=UPI0003F7980A|nr:zincin-like metallopeptidase domain-containing protein [Fundidesulfovibrio putealis]
MAVEAVARKPLHEVFAEQIIEDLKLGVAPWQKPWLPGQLYSPMNPVSGTIYSGINRLMLSRKGYADPRWMTLRQANSIDCRVRKGEKSQPIVFWQFTKDVPATDDQGKPVLDADGKQVMETVQLARPIVRFSSVFHVSQFEGNVPSLDVSTLVRTWDPDEKAEAILANSGAVIRHNQRNRAFYSPAKDEICLPPMERFPTPGNYYSTALHELGHWTGHESRMAREFGPFGSEVYAREELRAEIASWMLGQDLGIGHDPGQHLSYVNSWIKVLEQDPYEIVRACRDAERIKDYVLVMEHEQELGKGQEAASPNLSLPEGWSESRPGGLATNKDPVKGGIVDKVMLSTPDEWFAIPNDDGLLAQFKDKFFSSRAEAFAALKHAVEQSRDGITRDDDPSKEPAAPSQTATGKVFLAVPFREKNLAKAAGAKWDVEAKMWYAPEGADLDKLKSWLSKDKAPAPHKSMPPVEEFAQALRAAGLDLKGQSPIMDGKIHRVPVLGGKPQARDGAYQGHLDGVPNGWYQNYLTGEKTRWKATGHTLTLEQKAVLRQEAEQRLQQRERERVELQDQVARMCADNFHILPPIRPMAAISNPYLLRKGILPLGDIKESSDSTVLLIPLYNAEGQLRNVQEIDWGGTKRFQAGAEKKGCFCLVDQEKKLEQGEILLAEGYATGVSLHMATGKPVAVAFDAGNLEPVARNLREKFPMAKIVVCADNDHAREHGNIGVEKAKQTAQAVGGCVIVPEFTKEERVAGLTDWNDVHGSRGLDEVARQLDRGLSREKCQGMER